MHGGIDTQQFLPNATSEEVKLKIRETIDYFKDKSGYILSTSHVLEGDVSVENILAMFSEAHLYQN
ncbi:uroporphyrinogen decarboxylase family protein [Mariniphaga anaerophila]|uniref:uroporphyrinogen decarboxylase family protein n=1 Tax=Mariniphaga anaerophila TaxID=1484053 RepID=UPI0009355B32